jgi:hypothetical protein
VTGAAGSIGLKTGSVGAAGVEAGALVLGGGVSPPRQAADAIRPSESAAVIKRLRAFIRLSYPAAAHWRGIVINRGTRGSTRSNAAARRPGSVAVASKTASDAAASEQRDCTHEQAAAASGRARNEPTAERIVTTRSSRHP